MENLSLRLKSTYESVIILDSSLLKLLHDLRFVVCQAAIPNSHTITVCIIGIILGIPWVVKELFLRFLKIDEKTMATNIRLPPLRFSPYTLN